MRGRAERGRGRRWRPAAAAGRGARRACAAVSLPAPFYVRRFPILGRGREAAGVVGGSPVLLRGVGAGSRGAEPWQRTLTEAAGLAASPFQCSEEAARCFVFVAPRVMAVTVAPARPRWRSAAGPGSEAVTEGPSGGARRNRSGREGAEAARWASGRGRGAAFPRCCGDRSVSQHGGGRGRR